VTERLSDVLERALAGNSGAGRIVAESEGRRIEVEVVDLDRLGARVREIQVHRAEPFDVVDFAARAPRDLRDLPERIVPIEVDPRLGGANLRSVRGESRDDTYTDVEIRGCEARVTRNKRPSGADPEGADFTLTREQLGRVVDALGGSGDS
jgi:hypothetical protein